MPIPHAAPLLEIQSAPAPTPKRSGVAVAGAARAGRAEEAVAPASSATHRPPPALGLTRRQSEALAFIAVFIAVQGYSPSYADICAGLGLSPRSKAAAHALVGRLVERGAVVVGKGRANSIVLTQDAA